MENLNTPFELVTNLKKHSDTSVETKAAVKGINENLMAIFGISEKKTKQLMKIEINELSNDNEINSTEAQLAKMFGKYDKMMELNNITKQPISLTHIMGDFDNYHGLSA